MKIQHFARASLLITVTCAASLLAFSRPVGGQTNVLGNCGESSCADLLKQLESRWRKEVRQAKSQCYSGKKLALKVVGGGFSKKVILICWGAKNRDGVIRGEQLVVLPFPGEEENFRSVLNTESFDGPFAAYRLTRGIIARLYQQRDKYELACAMKDGNLNLQILDSDREGVSTKVNVECSYNPAILWDNNGDGIEDFESGGQLRGDTLDTIEAK